MKKFIKWIILLFITIPLSSAYSYEPKIFIRHVHSGAHQGYNIYVLRVSANIEIKDLIIEILANQEGFNKKESIQIKSVGGSYAEGSVDGHLELKKPINEFKITKVTGKIDGVKKDMTSYIEIDNFKPIRIILPK